MSFFERNRRQLAERGIDPGRLPPGQYSTERFPVLDLGDLPPVDLASWRLRIFGEVERPLTLSWDEFRALPATEVTTDIHCVTKWSKFNMVWKGVRLRDLYDLAGLEPAARHVLFHAALGYTANVPLEDTLHDDCLIAYEYDHHPLEPEHGYPARAFIPHLYFWKSVKWVQGIELLAHEQPGFWEQNGYHIYGDPFREQRFTND